MAKPPWSRYRFDPAGALRNFQEGPDIPRPNILAQQIPVVGSAWQAVSDLQDGDYVSAAINAGSAVAEATPVGAAVRGARALRLGAQLLEVAPKARTVTRAMRSKGLAGPGQEIHHAIPLKGKPRNLPDARNHPLLLKTLPKEQHRRIHGSWQGQPRYNPAQRVWYGTTPTMKTVPVGLLGYTVSTAENATRATPGRAASPQAARANSARR